MEILDTFPGFCFAASPSLTVREAYRYTRYNLMREAIMMIRPVQLSDAAAIRAIYQPYVTETAITFEVDVPTVQGI